MCIRRNGWGHEVAALASEPRPASPASPARDKTLCVMTTNPPGLSERCPPRRDRSFPGKHKAPAKIEAPDPHRLIDSLAPQIRMQVSLKDP